jgi:hypothetical protein
MKKTLVLFALMMFGVAASAKTPAHREYYPERMYCSHDGMNNMLLNEEGMVLKQFVFASDCQQAQAQQVNGFTCATDSANGTDLINSYSGSIFHYTFASNCMDSLSETASGYICATDSANGTVLLSSSGRQIQSFTFRSDCEQTRQNILNH